MVLLLLAAACTSDAPGETSAAITPASCEVLCISDPIVEGGQEVRVTFGPPEDHIWGVDAELRPFGAERIAWLYAFADDRELKTVWPGSNIRAFEDIGFHGRAAWKWTVPSRLEPGRYELVKQAIRDGSGTLEERTREWTVTFEVTS